MAEITVTYSENILEGTLEVLEASGLKALVKPGMTVSIKPNMVLAKAPAMGATTHAEVVEGLIRYLKELGVDRLEIIESAWIGGNTKQAYRVCGYDQLSKKYGVPLIDLKDDGLCQIRSGKYTFEVCRKAVETDFLINVPVLKAHCQTLLTCCLKNLKGCISDREKRRFHAMGLHEPIAYLNQAVKTHFCLVDGVCGDLTFEEGGNPVTRNMLLAGQDPLLMDSYGAELIGYQAKEIEYLRIASWLGVGRLFDGDAEVNELRRDERPLSGKADSGVVKRLAAYVSEDQACSACYSALIFGLHQMKEMSVGKPSGQIGIGQGFRGKNGSLGCGDCTNRFDSYVKGCPPTAADVVAFLKVL